MDFSGALNWGDVVVEIVISDVVFEEGQITGGEVVFNMNGDFSEYNLGIM